MCVMYFVRVAEILFYLLIELNMCWFFVTNNGKCYVWSCKGRFFEVLIGVRPDPLWQLLSKIAVLYSLEPIFTIVFVTNMNAIWESVMATLRAQIFRRVLIQKVWFVSCDHNLPDVYHLNEYHCDSCFLFVFAGRVFRQI